jgi:hypothetical protein
MGFKIPVQNRKNIMGQKKKKKIYQNFLLQKLPWLVFLNSFWAIKIKVNGPIWENNIFCREKWVQNLVGPSSFASFLPSFWPLSCQNRPNFLFHLGMLPEEEKEKVHGNVNNVISDSIGQETPRVQNKKRKLDFNEWADYSDNSAENELNLYRHLSLCENVDENLLNWWKIHSSTFPNLAKLAKKILSIPANSASSERNFSAAGSVVTERRTCLSPNNVDAILIIHDCKS